jgi:hypothetical protein
MYCHMFGKGMHCSTILTSLLITLIVMTPISTLQYLETSFCHRTPEHDSIGRDQKCQLRLEAKHAAILE